MDTSDVRWNFENCFLVKFADDTVLPGLITKEEDTAHVEQVYNFVNYCGNNFCERNMKETKEMVIDYQN